MNVLKKLLPHWPIVTLLAISLLVTLTNYRFGTYLSGWDTLHPEFNVTQYIQRVIFGAWQEHQGLGAPASQAHAAELPRLIPLFFLKVLLPDSLVRHLFFFVMYSLGGVGVYLFIRHCWFEKKRNDHYVWASFLGALLYLFNLGTLQHFYVPLEMFAVHFATIGFVMYSFYQCIQHPSVKNYALFFFIQIVSAPSAHTATLFYMYTGTLFLYGLIFALLISPSRRIAFRQMAILALITLSAHFYWIGPNAYYIFNHSDYVREAKISRQFSSEAFWQNQAFGNIADILIFKNFLFNWMDYNFEDKKFVPLLDEWENHLEKDVGYPFLNILALICLLGLVLSIARRDSKHSLAFFTLFIIPLFFINNLNFPSARVFIYLQSVSSTLTEALRFPFTKFSIVLMVAFSAYFAHFIAWALSYFHTLSEDKDRQYFKIGTVIIAILLVLYPMTPAFGNLVSPSMKVKYPSEYSQLFEWFSTQPHQSRVASFPLITQFGWTYNEWPIKLKNQGYQGAGFLWFGLEQPLLDREFDRWSETNEFFYYELSYAVDTENQDLFNKILKKYEVHWLLYDESALDPNIDKNASHKDKFLKMVSNNPSVAPAQSFNFLKVYQVQSDDESWITSSPTTVVNTVTERVRKDVIYDEVGDYISVTNSDLAYPFAHLAKETSRSYSLTGDSISTSVQFEGNSLSLPDWRKTSKTIPVEISAKLVTASSLQLTLTSILPTITSGDQSLSLSDTAPARSKSFILSIPDPSQTYILRIGDGYIIFTPSEVETVFGSFVVPLETFAVDLYAATPAVSFDLFDGHSYEAVDCATQAPNPTVSATDTQNGISVSTSELIACASKPQFHTVNSAGLLSLSFDYQSSTPSTYTRVCVFQEGVEGCINQGEYYIDMATGTPKTLQVFEPIFSAASVNVAFNLAANHGFRQLTYTNGALDFHPLLGTITLDAGSLQELAPRETILQIDPNPEQKTTITITQEFGEKQDLLVTRNLSSVAAAQNCASQGNVSFIPYQGSHTLTSSLKGIACEHFLFSGVSPLSDYLLVVGATNVQGKELLINVFDSEQEVVDEVFRRGPDTQFFWLTGNRRSNDISLSLQGHSYGEYESINQVNQLGLVAFPVSYVSQIKTNTEMPALSPSTVRTTKRIANFWYTASVNSESQSVLKLSQSYDRSWIAFPNVNILRPFTHVKHNSWANAWVIPPGSHSITILYLPQLLEFIGFALLGIVALYFFHELKTYTFSEGTHQPNKPRLSYQELRQKARRKIHGQ